MSSLPLHRLRIRDLQLKARLGCSAEERSAPQEVRVSVELRFDHSPRASTSDNLGDTICYAVLSKALREQLKEREYHLVEKMAADFYEVLKGIVEGRAKISLSVHKVRPPIEGLLGGVEYQVGDFA